MTNTKKRAGRSVAKKAPAVGQRIIQGLEEALAWSKGEDLPVRVTRVQVPDVDVSKVRRNWEQGRVRPDTPTRVLLAVIAKHPESVEDVLKDVR